MKRYLVVDDEAMSRVMLADVLSEFGPCDTAENGREGYELFEKGLEQGHPYALVCVDLMMPEMNGHELIRKIREREKSLPVVGGFKTKIFVISASNSPWDMADALLDHACDDYLVKPFQKEKLAEILEKNDLRNRY